MEAWQSRQSDDSLSVYCLIGRTLKLFYVNVFAKSITMFRLTRSVAADTGIHIGDGHLLIRQQGADTSYTYDITGNALDDQLYFLSHVIPTIESAYGMSKFGIYVPRQETWISIVYQSKDIALFKNKVLGLPNGRKLDLSIPSLVFDDPRLMKCCVREILSTDWLVSFYSASRKRADKYGRIQITMTARRVIEQIDEFLRQYIGIDACCRVRADTPSLRRRARHVLQINRAEDINVWRREIGFSNPSHISRVMVSERLGECPPSSNILERLSYLAGCSSEVKANGPLPRSAFGSILNEMRKQFGSPDLPLDQTLGRMKAVNERLRRLARKLPQIVADD